MIGKKSSWKHAPSCNKRKKFCATKSTVDDTIDEEFEVMMNGPHQVEEDGSNHPCMARLEYKPLHHGLTSDVEIKYKCNAAFKANNNFEDIKHYVYFELC